jgi:glutathione synthase/RimK-type ligase-like ATP-grasp enzyme
VGGHRPRQRAVRAPALTVALATCAEVPELDEDGPAVVAGLRARGVQTVPAVWDDPAVDWDGFGLVVLRSTWDYAERRDEFLDWINRLPRVLNAPEVVRWNTDKRYLHELAGAGLPVVPTRFLEPGEDLEPPWERFVVKPAISAGGRNTASYGAHELEPARRHLEALHAAGRAAMVQPYLDGVDVVGEAALIWLDGRYSHAVTKSALLRRGQRPGTELYLEETIAARAASAPELEVGARVLAALPFDAGGLLYARIDLLPTEEGPVVLEVELTEPSLFLGYEAVAAERLAAAITRRLGPCP